MKCPLCGKEIEVDRVDFGGGNCAYDIVHVEETSCTLCLAHPCRTAAEALRLMRGAYER